MKKAASVLLSLLILISSVSGLQITAQAAEATENKTLSYKYEYETKTLYITGKGEIPKYYLGVWYDDELLFNTYFDEKKKDYYIYEATTNTYTKTDYCKEDICIENSQLPDFYKDITRHVKHMVIGEGITDIGGGAFESMFPNLETVKLPSTLKSIGWSAFGYSNLKSVTIPEGTKYIHDSAFVHCNSLEAIVFTGKKTKIKSVYDEPYLGSPEDPIVYCPADSKVLEYIKDFNYPIHCIDYKVVSNPKKVGGLKASATSNTVKLTWSKVSGASQYQIQRYVSSQKKWKTIATAKTNKYTVQKLSGSTSYKFRVRAIKKIYDGKFYGSFSKTITAKTKPGKVSGVKLSAKKGKLTVKWSKTKGAKDYQIYYSAKKNGSYKRMTTTSKTSYTKKLKKGKTYYIKVRARQKQSNGKYTCGAFSDIKSIKIK